jgi:lipopolysaccharide transport system ATP-binding protein
MMESSAAVDQASDVLVSVRSVSKCYHLYPRPQDRLWQAFWRGRRQYYREFWALRDVSLEVRRGETIGIIGRNGAGKSTLLQMIAGTLTPTSGEVRVNGRIAALLQLGSGFNPGFTGRENVFLNGAILGFSEAQIAERFDDIAAFADIGDFIDQPVKTYSSGMMVRLAFAVSTCLEPEILIVDEALAVGDAAFQFKCRNRLDQLVERGSTLLFVSHDITLVKALCNRALYLAGGKERAHGSPVELAEMYFMDLRSDQAKAVGQTVVAKQRLQGREGISFGTADGRIVSAVFASNGHSEAAFMSTAEIVIDLVVEYAQTLKQPALSVIFQAANLLNLGGRWVYLPAATTGVRRQRVRCRVPARFAAGHYHVTVRLEERSNATDFFPIDRQAGLLTFEVAAADDEPLLPAVDLGMSLTVGDPEA